MAGQMGQLMLFSQQDAIPSLKMGFFFINKGHKNPAQPIYTELNQQIATKELTFL